MVTAMHFLGALALLCVGPTSRDTLSGRVTDSDGAPVPAATVLISELHRVATTGADGGFGLAGLPTGEYTVIVRHVGFAPFAREVAVRGPTTLTVTLRRTPVWVEPVTITATGAPIAALGSPLSTAALSADGLRREQSVSLAHSLSRLPGVNALSTGAQIGKPVIRGLAGARVLVLANGNRLEDYSWSDEDGPSVDTRLAQRVEVIRGPASVLYGSDALGGVVNVIPAELPDANGGPRMIRTGFEVSGATNNAEVEAAARIEGASGAWAWRAFGIGRAAGSLHTPAGELDNTGFGALNGEAAVGRRGAGGSTTLRYTRYAGEFKLLEANERPSGAPPACRGCIKRTKHAGRSRLSPTPARAPRLRSCSSRRRAGAGACSPAAASICAVSPPTATPRSPWRRSGATTRRGQGTQAWCTGPSRRSRSPRMSAARGARPRCSSCSRTARTWARHGTRLGIPA